ncbi:integrase [Bradyrhizobium ottawaense]|uniref:site-specific integrase n=1 Tax=Bradyrhizobium ottawaense TaxID=931866 RepID=UPI00351779BA
MPRASQGPYLRRRAARYKDGKLYQRSVWVIRDGKAEVSTGCVAESSQVKPPAKAQQALADYISRQYNPRNTSDDIKEIDVADVLLVYLNDKVGPDKPEEEKTSAERHLEQTIGRINEFFGGKMLSEINTQLCKSYVKNRISEGGGEGGARRDLEMLRAAVNFHSSENLHYGKVSVWLPDKGETRDRWLTRSEAAAMIWKAWRYREVQTIHVGPNKGQKVISDRRPLRHVARFLLIGLYTGTRAGAIASAAKVRAPGKSFVDLENGVFYRKPTGKKATKKRQPPAPIPPRLLAHLKRWDRLGIAKEHFVEWNGKAVISVKKAFRTVVKEAKIDLSAGPVVPHTLRHTAATWLMQRGVNLWTAAGYLGMTVEVLERTYGHHHPDHLAEAVQGITAKKIAKKAAA